jgi:sugar (pentulose or hexulose) kinase
MEKTRKSGVILCADIGTTALKAAFIDAEAPAGRRLLAFSRETYHASTEGGVAASLWEAAFYRAVKVLRSVAPAAAAGIAAVCVSGNGPTLVPVIGDAAQGETLPPLYWFSPALAAPPALKGGKKPASLFLPRAAYFRQNQPENYSRTSLFLSCQEWLSVRLGAEPVTVLPTPHYRQYYYDEGQLAVFSLDNRKFPPFVPLGSFIGCLSAEAARLCDLAAGIPIAAGGPDFIMALLGSGATEPGVVCDRAGSSEGINVCASEPPPGSVAAAHSLRVLPHAVEGLWNVSVVIPESGRLIDRYRLENGQWNIPYEETLKSMISWADGRLMLHPILREITDKVRRALETLRAAGYPVYEMRHSGGQAKSPLWNRLKAEICGCKLLVPEIPDTELAGDAAAAMLALSAR